MIAETEISFQYLGSSQTFVGTLATIVLMCILVGNSNFIYTILKAVANQMQKQCNPSDLPSKVSFAGLYGNDSYKLLQLSADETNKQKPELRNKASQKLLEISMQISQFQFQYIPPKLSSKVKSPEHFLAPLYSFAFVMIMFIFDELLRSSHIGCNDLLVSTLSVFTLLSYIYWSIAWFVYCSRLYNSHYSKYRPKGIIYKIARWVSSRGLIYSCIIRIVFILVSIGFALVISKYAMFVGDDARFFLFWSLGVVFPSLLIGYPLTKASTRDVNRGYLPTILHVCLLGGLSMVISLLVLNLASNFEGMSYLIKTYDDSFCLKTYTILFVLLNGLLIPLFLPFLCYKLLCVIAQKAPSRAQKEVEKMIEKWISEIQEINKEVTLAQQTNNKGK